MDLKKSSITADIINILSDCKLHKMQEIADIVEVSEKTVRNHIKSISYRYPIQTFCGNKNGGVKLDENYLFQGRILTNDELQIIGKALSLLQKDESNDVDNETLNNLIIRFTSPNIKEQSNNGNRKQIG
ncbi:MAG: HTH domain-containing protein [Clostridia bacterium]|nr:HTH domain-containing protein [Clostridia bacterium]